MPRENVLIHAAPDVTESGLLQYLLDSCPAQTVARGQGEQVIARRPRAVGGLRVKQYPDMAKWIIQRCVGPPADSGGAAGGPVEAEDQSHGGGLARAVRSEESGDPAGTHTERETVHGTGGTVILGEFVDVDSGHVLSLAAGPGSGPPPPVWIISPARGAVGSSALAR